MHRTPSMPPWMFVLDGTFLGFLGNELAQTTHLTLDVEQEHIPIELPSNFQQALPHWLQPGVQIRCIGHSQLDTQAKVLKLNAYQVFSLSSHANV
ncbi:MAG: hypothetical protein F6J95_013545 [Leptolyngbya sp. SIO1E4]|nr:hypothetical protein [Leptolyngbya sp. SIO1E4]